jgi:hypothetical protein
MDIFYAMTKTNERFQHGEHNEKACDYLNLNAEFRDWVITTSFYSALHFVSSKIFPFDVPAIEGKKTKIESIDQYHKYYNNTMGKGRNVSKHELLLDLVETRVSQAFEFYDWLFSIASTSRYSHYQHQAEISNLAISYMRKVKKICST